MKTLTPLPLFLSEEEALEILADLHGGGDTSNELVVLEFEEIKQQVVHFGLGKWSSSNSLPYRSISSAKKAPNPTSICSNLAYSVASY